MPFSVIPYFLSYCFINGITPGPANLSSLAAAMKEGRQAALLQWKGLFVGFAIVSAGSVLVNQFLGSVLGDYVRYLSWIGAAYLLWMAWNMIRPVLFSGHNSGAHQVKHSGGASFRRGMIIQLTNVKIIQGTAYATFGRKTEATGSGLCRDSAEQLKNIKSY